jgi:hypothetical protein
MEKTEKKFIFCLVAGDTQTEVHIDGCNDIQRGVTKYNKTLGGHVDRSYQGTTTVIAETVDDAVEKELEKLNEEFGEGQWLEQDFAIMPCCRKK